MAISKLMLSLVLVAATVAATSARAEESMDDLMNLMGATAKPAETEDTPTQRAAVSVLRQLLTAPTAEQNIFIQFYEAGDMERALYQWPSAFEGTDFAKSQTGRALNAFVLFKNGVKVFSLETLLAIDEPAKISPIVIKFWKDTVKDTDPLWSLVGASLWKPAWTDIFGPTAEVRVRGRQVFDVTEIETVKDLIKKSERKSMERAWLEWQAVLGQATGGDAAVAARALSFLMKEDPNPVSQDLMTLTAARLLFQNGYLDAAIKYYEKIPKSSDDWFDAQEEMAWSQVRKGEPQDAIAITKTLVNPAFANLIGPETVFVRALALLKVCDYPEVSTTLALYRDRFRDRAKVMLELSETGNTPAVQKFMARAKNETLKQTDLGVDGAKLPRFITRDEILKRTILSAKQLDLESAKFKELYARSLTGGTGKVGFQGRLEDLHNELDKRARAVTSSAYARIKTLAEDEVNEIAQTLQKMQIVEAEIIQQVAMAGRVSEATANSKLALKKGSTGAKGKDTLNWPVEQETWFDELANYKVDLKKGCQSVTR